MLVTAVSSFFDAIRYFQIIDPTRKNLFQYKLLYSNKYTPNTFSSLGAKTTVYQTDSRNC